MKIRKRRDNRIVLNLRVWSRDTRCPIREVLEIAEANHERGVQLPRMCAVHRKVRALCGRNRKSLINSIVGRQNRGQEDIALNLYSALAKGAKRKEQNGSLAIPLLTSSL